MCLKGPRYSLYDKIVLLLFCLFGFGFGFSFKFGFILGSGGCKGRGWIQGNREVSAIGMHDVISTESQSKICMYTYLHTFCFASGILFTNLVPSVSSSITLFLQQVLKVDLLSKNLCLKLWMSKFCSLF